MTEDENGSAWHQLSAEERRAYNRGRMQKLTRNREPAPSEPARDPISPMQHILAPLKTALPLKVSRLITAPPLRVHKGAGFRNFERAHPVIANWWKSSKDKLAMSLRAACMQYGGSLTPKQLAFAYKLAKKDAVRKASKRGRASRLEGTAEDVEPSSDETDS